MNDNDHKDNVGRIYKKILYRDADPYGLQHYIILLKKSKITLEDIEKELLQSDEAKTIQLKNYYREHLSTLYKKILFRDVDKDGLEYYISLLKESKITLEDIEKELLQSDEAQKRQLDEIHRKIMKEYFQQIMEREPNDEDMAYFMKMIGVDGLSIEDVKKLIHDSSEALHKRSKNFLKYAPNFKTSFSELELNTMLQSVKWYHYFKFGNVETPAPRTTLNFQMLIAQDIPIDLSGKSVLDIGANNGFYSFLCESRGAKRVLAMDSEEYNAVTNEHGDTKGFKVCKKILNSNVEYRKMNVLDLDSLNETFDIVLFFGVYYHLEDPVLALRKIFSHVNETLFLAGHIVDSPEPIMCYYDKYEMDSRDDTNWWAASPSCLLSIGHRIGFRDCELVDTINIPHQYGSQKIKKSIRNLTKIGIFKFSK